MLTFDKSFRIIWHPKDEELQDYCDWVKNSMLGILWNSEQHVWTVVLCAHNEELYLPWTLASIAWIATREKVRVLVIDNNSSDRTSMIAKECGVEIVHETKKWLSYARQAGLENASWELVFSTDADVRVPPTWIDSSIEYFREDHELVGLSGWIIQPLHPLHRALRQVPKAVRSLARLNTSYFRQNFSGGNTIYKRDIALKAWWYPQGFDLGEDFIIWERLRSLWKTLVINDDPRIDIEVSPRRVDSSWKVLQLYIWWFFSSHWLKRSQAQKSPTTFKDIR